MDYTPQQSLSQLAIDAALDSRWDEALKLNKQIIKVDPQNIDALNRQARVYMEMGRINLAKKYYSEVIGIDPYNPIALKNLKIIKSFKPNGHNVIHQNFYTTHLQPNSKLLPYLFLHEPGKTKLVNLLKVAEPQKLSKAYCGMKVQMQIKNRRITIADLEENYLGVLPDDICFLLLKLLKGGSKYEIFIKSIKVNGLSVLIKETFRSKRLKNQPSFLETSDNTLLHTDILTSLDSQNDAEEEPDEAAESQAV